MKKMFTTTTISTRHEWANQDRIVTVSSGRTGVSLTVAPNPSTLDETRGTTGLTADQAEKLGKDLLERVAEIRAGLEKESA